MTAAHLIKQLQLQPHPEGGFYEETYRSNGMIAPQCLPDFKSSRHYSTAIYFLLQQNDFSAFHRIASDECWHFYEGGTLLIHMINQEGHYQLIKLGRKLHEGESFQFVVPGGWWFASEPAEGTEFALVGCTVAPGFDFADFEMAKAQNLAALYPQHRSIIKRLCR